ncbi:MAG: hypothetical protein MRY32_10155 [Rickettsiales bacterium]|nr:hypothetical protein [Rickettsiales bacterium]
MLIRHSSISDSELRAKIRDHSIQCGGNVNLKIYGTLACKSGKRMKRGNRVFFENETEAIEHGYRPCGNCMNDQYKEWISLNK